MVGPVPVLVCAVYGFRCLIALSIAGFPAEPPLPVSFFTVVVVVFTAICVLLTMVCAAPTTRCAAANAVCAFFSVRPPFNDVRVLTAFCAVARAFTEVL